MEETFTNYGGLVVAPTSVSSAETGNLDTSNAYSKKYARVLAQTGEDAVVDLEGVYKKTFTSVMDTAVSYAKETIGKIQEIFDKNLIGVKFEISQEEIDKIQNFVLSNKDGKKVDISGQITKAKQEVEELNENIKKTAKLLDDTKSKGNVKFDGFDKFTQDVSKSIGKLEELQNILKALQNIEITLASEFISRVNSVQSEIKNIDVASPEGLARLKEIDLIVDEIISDSKLLENKLIKQDSKIADIISKMKIFRDSNTNMSKSQRADLQALIDSAEVIAKTGDVTAEAIEHIKIGFSGIKSEVTATGNTGLKMIDRIVQRAEDMNAKFIAQFFSWQDWLRYLREGFTIINEIYKSITELRKVSNGTASDLNHALKSATEDAKELGSSISNIVSMQSDWARLGFSIPESEELARVTQLYVNVGDNMSAETASENLISTLQGFQLEAEDSERIIDMFNEVAKFWRNYMVTYG